jgi:hypothetical protein
VRYKTLGHTGLVVSTVSLGTWQVRTTLLIGTVGPPVASLILMPMIYLQHGAGRLQSFDVSWFAATYILFAVPVGYVFGVAPALLAGALYCGALTAMAAPRSGMLLRACLGAACGGLVGAVWFRCMIGPDWHGYGSVAALVATLLSLRRPPAPGYFLGKPAR